MVILTRLSNWPAQEISYYEIFYQNVVAFAIFVEDAFNQWED